ncbi:EF-hand domain-containing protein [Pelagibacteraceae bacterium]|nr:EF-hand domain-containing protein [Pelagibacteraceae bacterium]
MKKIFLILFVSVVASTTPLAAEKKSITKKEFIDSNIKKLEQQFNAIDSNKDGKMTPAEERAYVQRVQKARLLRRNLAILADTDKNGKISKEEEKKLLTKMDVNKDGSVTPKEQENYYNKNKTKK